MAHDEPALILLEEYIPNYRLEDVCPHGLLSILLEETIGLHPWEVKASQVIFMILQSHLQVCMPLQLILRVLSTQEAVYAYRSLSMIHTRSTGLTATAMSAASVLLDISITAF